MPTLVVAAMREEVGALRAALGDRPYRLGIVGETAARAAPALKRLIAKHRPGRILLLGVCGGLTPDLKPCDLVVPAAIGHGPDAAWLAALPADLGHRGRLATVERMAASEEAKRRLAARLGPDFVAVDMETKALDEVAHEHGVPLLVIRAISDTVAESMPDFLLRCFRKDGSMSRLRVVLAANVRPKRWKVLMAMRRRMVRCSEVLAEAAVAAVACAPD